MASTYNNLGIELQATGENAGTWGTKTNTNLDLIAETWGYLAIDVASGDVTLAMSSGSSSNARNYILEFTGTLAGNRIVNVPAQAGSPAANIEKGYLVVDKTNRSGSNYSLTFKVTSQTGVVLRALPQDKSSAPVTTFCYHNGTDIIDASKDVAMSFTDGQYIADSNGNELVAFGVTGSAVNEVKITNAATGTAGPIIAAQGETNVDLRLSPAGSGEIALGTGSAAVTVTTRGAHDLTLDTNSGTNSGTITITDGANGSITATPNGTGVVEIGGNTNPGTLQLNCESNSHGIKLQSPPHSSSQSYTLKFPTGNVTADRFLKVASVTGSGTTGVGQLSFAEVSGGTSYQAVKTSGFTAVAGEGYFCNTTSAAFTATLPSSGTIGDEITFIDYAGTFDTNNLTVGRNSHNIQGSAADLTVSTERAGFTLVYVDSTQGWLLKDK